MTPAIYPRAVQRPVSYAPAAGSLDHLPRGWVLHVVVGNGSPFRLFEGAKAGSRRFSHLWFAKSGLVEQYAPLTGKSWAQAGGNPRWWSAETEGFPGEPLTDAQLDALAEWHVWCGAVDHLAEAPDEQGIGTHQMGGAAWGGHACPGPIRAGQRAEILRRAATLRTSRKDDDTMPTAREVADALLDQPAPGGELGSDGHPLTIRYMLARTYQSARRIEAKAFDYAALAAELARHGVDVDEDAVAAAVVRHLGEQLADGA